MTSQDQHTSERVVLEARNLKVSYGVITALHGISFLLKHAEIVTLIGANGAGKTTTLRAISGLIKTAGGEVWHEGQQVTNLPAHKLVGRGVAHVPEGRMIFSNLTVAENLRMGAFLRHDAQEITASREYVFGIFPVLKERQQQIAGTLSGGEQQMLAIGRALMSKPRLLMLDEPSLGIAPKLVSKIFEKIVEINREQQITVLLVEQNANLALEISHRGYVLETGRIILQDSAASLRQDAKVKAAYLGG